MGKNHSSQKYPRKLFQEKKKLKKKKPIIAAAAADCSKDRDDDKDYDDFMRLYRIFVANKKKEGDRDDQRSGWYPFPHVIRNLNDEERCKYETQVEESDGFDVDYFPDGYDLDMIEPVPVSDFEAKYEYFRRLTISAVEHYNNNDDDGDDDKSSKKKKKIEFYRAVKANFQYGYPSQFYITFEARNASDDDNDGGQIDVFQALISLKLCGDDQTVVFCRPKPKPKPPQSSSDLVL